MNREKLAAKVLEGLDKFPRSGEDVESEQAYVEDHQEIADAILDGASCEELEAHPAVNRWPETYTWLMDLMDD